MAKKSRESSDLPDRDVMDLRRPLERLDGDRELLAQLAQIFLEDGPMLLSRLRQEIAQGNLSEAGRAAHSLKGLASNFDAHRTTFAAMHVEGLTRTANRDEILKALDVLEQRVGELQQALTRWLDSRAPIEPITRKS